MAAYITACFFESAGFPPGPAFLVWAPRPP